VVLEMRVDKHGVREMLKEHSYSCMQKEQGYPKNLKDCIQEKL